MRLTATRPTFVEGPNLDGKGDSYAYAEVVARSTVQLFTTLVPDRKNWRTKGSESPEESVIKNTVELMCDGIEEFDFYRHADDWQKESFAAIFRRAATAELAEYLKNQAGDETFEEGEI